MPDIISNMIQLNFEEKLAKSLEPFLRYLMFFWVTFENRFFEFLTPVKWDFFLKIILESCVFKLSFERVVAEPVKSIFRRVIAILVFRGYSKKVSLGR